MKNLSKIIAVISTATLAAASVMSFSGSAATTVRDANGDGVFDIADAVDTTLYLAGLYNPTNVKSYDFDGNGIISEADIQKIQCRLVKLISKNSLPGPSTEVSPVFATRRTYYKHDCSSSDSSSKTMYSLIVNSHDNTSSDNADISLYNIIPPNNMVRDYDTSVVKLNMKGVGHASGFIVGDHLIATAAHCVYGKGKFYDMTVDIVDDKNNNIATFTPSYIHIPFEYARYEKDYYNYDYDYALIYVEEDLSDYGMFKMGVALDEYVNKKGSVIVSGFPGEYPDNYTGEYGVRFKAQGNVDSENQYRLYYDADTFAGDSGGPVYVEEGFSTNNGDRYEYKTVVAINTHGFNENTNPNGKNSGIKITPDILKFFYENSNIAN